MNGKCKPIAIDLFAGVGGMSLGIKQAGFRVVGAFDVEARHIRAYKINFPTVSSHVLDLAKATSTEIRSLSRCDSEDIDLVFGGPPCQGFSVGGRHESSDERNLLILHFMRLVRSLRPKYFVLENVQGLLSRKNKSIFDSVLKRARLAGYRIAQDIQILNASDFGVPQRRKRVFFLGYRSDCSAICYPDPQPIIDQNGKGYYPVVSDAIADLPEVDKFDFLFNEDGYTGPLGDPSHYAKLMRNQLHEANDRYSAHRADTSALTGCLRTRHDPQIVKRFRQTLPGSIEPISRYYRLSADGVAPTIRAGTGSDRGSHTSPRPIHPIFPRCITVREAARLHSFPDWFQFDPTRWHAFRQIGNSVPPRLARVVSSVVIDVF